MTGLATSLTCMQITVELWHDSDDNCGERCNDSLQILQDLSSEHAMLSRSNVIIEPHFVFSRLPNPCSDDQTACASNCVAGRYCILCESARPIASDGHPPCHLRCFAVIRRTCHCTGIQTVTCCRYCKVGSAADSGNELDLRHVMEEDLRRMCLLSVLQNATDVSGMPLDQTVWWQYVMHFQDTCRTSSGSFTAHCAERVRRPLLLLATCNANRQSCSCSTSGHNFQLSKAPL
jgi:hypothetical protein